MSVRGCAHGFAFGYCPTCQGLNPGLTPPVVFDFTGQSPDRYAKALAVVEAARELLTASQGFPESPAHQMALRAALADFDEVADK